MLESIFEDILAKRSQDILSSATQYPKNNPTASDISGCARETALAILHWQERPPFEEKLLARFEVGNDQEKLAMSKLLRYGFQIVEQQQNFELRDKKKRLILRGRIDGKIEVDKKRIPFDYKTINPMMFERFNTLEDLLNHKFFSKYPKQLWAYEYMNDIDTGFIWMDNLLGQWKFIEIPMDWDAMEKILQQCEGAVDAVENVRAGKSEDEALPHYHKDPAICLSCWSFKRICTPPFFRDEGMKIFDDPELEEKIDRYNELKPMHSEFEKVKKGLLPLFANKKDYVIGKWLVGGEEKERNNKAQEAKKASKTTYWSTTFELIEKPAVDPG